MITNTSESKEPVEGVFLNIPKYVGVGSVNVKAVNPDNETLKKYGWTIPDGAKEQEYVYTTDKDGNPTPPSARICLLVQIQDCEDKPIVTLPFWIRPEVMTSNANGVQKAKIIDNYCRSAWATKEEIETKNIAKYENGREKVDNNFRFCHFGEAEILLFLQRYLGCTPYEVYDRNLNKYVKAKNPSTVLFDDWNALCSGNVKELVGYLADKPNNRTKVVFGVRVTPDNKAYQVFLTDTFINNGSLPDKTTGEYTAARKAIDKYVEYQQKRNTEDTFVFSAAPVKKWETTASVVSDNSNSPEIPGMSDTEEDLPF